MGAHRHQNQWPSGDDGDLIALRVGNWKAQFQEQQAEGIKAWVQPFTKLRTPQLYNLRSDPFERGDTAMFYDKVAG